MEALVVFLAAAGLLGLMIACVLALRDCDPFPPDDEDEPQ